MTVRMTDVPVYDRPRERLLRHGTGTSHGATVSDLASTRLAIRKREESRWLRLLQ